MAMMRVVAKVNTQVMHEDMMTGTIASAVSILDGTEILPKLQEVRENDKPTGREGGR